MKDPAVLFYTSDFLNGVSDLTMEERGQYITLLCLQHQKGHLSIKMIRLCVGNAAADVLAKFRQDEDGNYYNERMDVEIGKRSAHADKQRQRAIDGWKKRKATEMPRHENGNAAAMPLENENENEDIIIVSDEVSYEIISTNSNLNSEEQSKRARPSRRQLFRNSPYANFDDFASKVYKPEYEDVDLEHYHRAIMAWSDIKDARELRTPEGWIQTAHLWIRKDAEKGKVVKKSAQKVHTAFGPMDQRTIDYLNL